jgi:carbamoyltransferase
MRIIGVNKGKTCFGKPLHDGGMAIIEDGKLKFAISEERLSRCKHDGGFTSCLNFMLGDQKTITDSDLIVTSTCCESQDKAALGHELSEHPNLITANHHLSHAYQAFFQSGFDEAIIAVIDGGGNTFSANNDDWWRVQREQHSYYIGNRQSVTLLDRDFFEPYEVGFGELYRAFTYYLGFPSGLHASKVMALAGHGRRAHFKNQLCAEIKDDHLSVPIENDPHKPIEMIRRLGDILGFDFGEPREPGGEVLQIHKDLAAYVQKTIEELLMQKLLLLKKQYNVNNLCVSGGLFLNCVCNGKLLSKHIFDNVYVPSAPGDNGQCIGNAIYGDVLHNKQPQYKVKSFACHNSTDAALGPPQEMNYGQLADVLSINDCRKNIVINLNNPSWAIAQLISAGEVIALFQQKSEIGPRALGNRSIIADPRDELISVYLNNLKGREWFMPFAPIVFFGNDYFNMKIESPFMSFASLVKEEFRNLIPATINKDDTSRIQTIHESRSSLISNILKEFGGITGVPVLLNTSFNLSGEPIVETIQDAVNTFSKMSLNAMALGNFLIVKNITPQMISLGLLPKSFEFTIEIQTRDGIESITANPTCYKAIRWVQQKTGQLIFVRSYFPLYKNYLNLLRSNHKKTTTRFKPNTLELPLQNILPLIETVDFGNATTQNPTAMVRIKGIRYKKFGDLSEEDAAKDGFNNLDEMRHAFIGDIYPTLREDDWVSVYSIELLENYSSDF